MPTGTFRGALARRSTLAVALAMGLALAGPAQAVDPAPNRDGHEIFGPATTSTPRTPTRSQAVAVPAGFQDTTIFSGLTGPTDMQFAADGRVFVSEKNGKIKVFSSVFDSTPTVFADLSTNVYNFWDRGLLGIALDPSFGTNGNVYALYTYNHILGDPSPPPKWPGDGRGNDSCPTPPGPTSDGCLASGRLSRLHAGAGGTWDGVEHVLVEAWCQQYPSHSIGTVAFGPDHALYAGAGEGANFQTADWGQTNNACGDPPTPGSPLTVPASEGGALRAQSLRRTAGEPAVLNGSIIRVNPTDGTAFATNPNISSPDLNARRIIAYGLRNPFRFTFKPGTSQIWIGEVGWGKWDEFDRVDDPTSAPKNFGWPCYEGPDQTSGYSSAGLTMCQNLYTAGTATAPFFALDHANHVVPGDPCPPPPAAIPGTVLSGVAFYPSTAGTFPATYAGALFFADQARKCIWAMKPDGSGVPDPTQIETFASLLPGPVDVKVGPDQALYYVGYDDGTVHRISYGGPSASLSATPTSGQAPLQVQFDASGSTGTGLLYAWDFTGSGVFGGPNISNPTWTYGVGTFTARVRVTDSMNRWDIKTISISAGNSPPIASIASPPSTLTWTVGQTISFSGSATDAQDGTEPGSRLTWTLQIHHCPSACHVHDVQSFIGTGGSFSAPDHEFPSSLILTLVATDANGASSAPVSVTLQPRTVDLTINSNPAGAPLSAGSQTATAPYTYTAIIGSRVGLVAPSTASIGGQTMYFVGWSDGQPASHTLTAPASPMTLTARYTLPTNYVPIDPIRIVDTRINVGLAGKLTGNVARSFVVAGANGIPANAVAITGNVTAVDPTNGGYLVMTRVPNNNPPTSTINLPAHDTRANGVTMTLADDGKLSAVYRAPSATTDLIVDVTGYFTTAPGARFTPLGPNRALDSRTGTGGYSTPFVSGVARRLQLGGAVGIPSNAVAVTGNLTVTGQTAGGYVAMTTQLDNNPSVSTLNVPLGDTRANGLTIKLDGTGRVSLVYRGGPPGSHTANLIFDVTGYYLAGSGMQFYPIQPTRSVDTRLGLGGGILSARTPRTMTIAGPDPIPANAAVIAGNATVVGQTAGGYLAMTSTPTSSPTTSTINFPLGDTRANNLTLALSGGQLSAIYMAPSGKKTHLILDISGYFR